MKKFFLIWAVLVLAAPAMAVVTVTATPDANTGNVDLVVTWSGEGTPPRAFAIDVNVTSDVNITAVTGYHTGESRGPGDRGFGIFPASFNREIDADDPNWDDANYTPVADVCDLPGDTLGGIGTSGVTLELGSLYTGPNVPTSGTTLATVTVDGSCTLCIARNVGRGKVVLEDGNEPSSFVAPCVSVTVVVVCTVPSVVDTAEAAACAAIVAAGFVCDTTTLPDDYDDSIVAGNIISQVPGPGVATCGSTVQVATSLGPCVVPNVVGMAQAAAEAAINAAGFTDSNDFAYDDSVAIGLVISQAPGTGVQLCGSNVNITVSLGPCVLIDLTPFDKTTAEAGIIGLGFNIGPQTFAYDDVEAIDEVLSQVPLAGTWPCGSDVNLHISLGPCVVPNVVGMDETPAEAAIIAAGFVLGTKTPVDGGGAPIGEVMAQTPASGGTPGCGTAVDIDVSAECMAATNPDYTNWALNGKPDCWCYSKHCRGDTDNSALGSPFWVNNTDKSNFVPNWNLFPDFVPPMGAFAGDICADFTHSYGGPFWVDNADKSILVLYWNLWPTFQPPFGPPDCSGPGCDAGDAGDPHTCDTNPLPNTEYNYWK